MNVDIEGLYNFNLYKFEKMYEQWFGLKSLNCQISLSNLSTFWGIAEITSENKGDACAIIKEET